MSVKRIFYNNYLRILFVIITSFLLFFNCSVLRLRSSPKALPLTEKETVLCKELKIDVDQLSILKAKPLYEFSPKEIDIYLKYLYNSEPDVRKRIVHLARKNVGQPYQIYLLGEFPFEIYDADPLYSLDKSDCVVFSEHMYAMGFAHDWQSFFTLLQRIRYKNGEISTLKRNHWTIADWEMNNSWLVEDISEELVGEKAIDMVETTGRKNFFKKYGLGQDLEDTSVKTKYIPAGATSEAIGKLQEGDFVNIIRGFEKGEWCGHVGLITIGDDGTVNFLHSTPPKVKEQPILEYMNQALKSNEKKIELNKIVDEEKKKPKPEKKWWQIWVKKEKPKQKQALFYGFKFLRLQKDALENLKTIDGQDAPVVKGPSGLLKKYPERKSND